MAINGSGPLRKHAAYHEAGHVVADLVFGYRFRFVSIRPCGPGEDDGSAFGTFRGRARDLAVARLAGIAAAARADGNDPWEETGWSDDDRADISAADRFIDNWVIFLSRTYGEAPCPEKIEEEVRKRTRQLVDTNQGPVGVIAGTLLERETLSYDDAVRILKERCPEFMSGERG